MCFSLCDSGGDARTGCIFIVVQSSPEQTQEKDMFRTDCERVVRLWQSTMISPPPQFAIWMSHATFRLHAEIARLTY